MPGRRVVSSALMTMVMAGQPQAAIKTWKDLNHRCYGQVQGPDLSPGPGPISGPGLGQELAPTQEQAQGQGLGFGLTGIHEVMWPLGQAAIALGNRSVLLEILQILPPTIDGDDDDALAAALLLSSTSPTPTASGPPHPLLYSPESAATGVCWMLSQGRLDLALSLWQAHCNNYHNYNHTSSNNINSNSNRSSALVLDMVCRSALLRSSPAYHHLNHHHNDNNSNNNTSSSSSSNSTKSNSNDSYVAASADFCAHLLLQPSAIGAPLSLTTVPGLSDRFVLKSFDYCTSSQTINQSIHINSSIYQLISYSIPSIYLLQLLNHTYRLVSLFGLVQHSDAAAAVVTQGLGLGQRQGPGTSPCLSANSMAIVLQMLVRGQSQSSNSSGDGNSDYRLVIDLFDLYLKQHNQLQQQQQQQEQDHVHANNNGRDASPSPVPSSGHVPGLPAKLFSPVLQALDHLQEYDLMLSLLQVVD